MAFDRAYQLVIGDDNVVRLVAANGSSVMDSKQYATKAGAVRAAETLAAALGLAVQR